MKEDYYTWEWLKDIKYPELFRIGKTVLLFEGGSLITVLSKKELSENGIMIESEDDEKLGLFKND